MVSTLKVRFYPERANEMQHGRPSTVCVTNASRGFIGNGSVQDPLLSRRARTRPSSRSAVKGLRST